MSEKHFLHLVILMQINCFLQGFFSYFLCKKNVLKIYLLTNLKCFISNRKLISFNVKKMRYPSLYKVSGFKSAQRGLKNVAFSLHYFHCNELGLSNVKYLFRAATLVNFDKNK